MDTIHRYDDGFGRGLGTLAGRIWGAATLRRCLVALSEETQLLRDLFSFRFVDAPLEGRSFGNLFFLALTKILSSEKQAIEALSRILKI